MRYCKFRNKKGGSKVNINFPKPSQTHASAEDVLGDMSKEQAIRNKSGGGKNDVVVPTMDQGGKDATASTKTAVSGLLQAQEDSKYDTPPPLKGGRRRTKRKRKKSKRNYYTSKRRKTRRKNRKKRTRRRGGVKTSPPRKVKQRVYSIPSPIKEAYVAKKETYDPEKLLKGPKPKKTNAPRHSKTATAEAFKKARQIAYRTQQKQGVFSKPIYNPPKGKKGGRKTRKKMRKRKRKKTRK